MRAWIETLNLPPDTQTYKPPMRAWIETSSFYFIFLPFKEVAPYAGAWIETSNQPDSSWAENVAPYAGAWIETQYAPK